MSDSKIDLQVNHGGKTWPIPVAAVMFVISAGWNFYSSFATGSQATILKLSEMSAKIDQLQSDNRELKENVRELTKTVNQQNEILSNRITVVEVKSGLK